MKIEHFIEEHRELIINHILLVCPNCTTDDDEIELWISNDKLLYNLALAYNVEGIER